MTILENIFWDDHYNHRVPGPHYIPKLETDYHMKRCSLESQTLKRAYFPGFPKNEHFEYFELSLRVCESTFVVIDSY